MNAIKLWPNSTVESTLTPYLLPDGHERPAILVIPGGGYGSVCESTEGGPIARRFNELGFHAFVLNYRVAPHRFPLPQQDAMRAMRLIRAHAGTWRVKADNVAVCGFSAGAHLAACLGTLVRDVPTERQDAVDDADCRPDAMLLCYGVLSFAPWSHQGSIANLLGDQAEALRVSCSPADQVKADTPPAFVWHTAKDQVVNYRHSLVFAEAMWRERLSCELHVWPEGPHGMQLGYGREDLVLWPEQARAFLHGTCGFRFPGEAPKRTVVLTFDDAVTSHLTEVAPILKAHGFGATFFICRFNDAWRERNEAHLLNRDEVKALADMGFEIGHHTINHPDLRQCSDAEIQAEIAGMTDWLGSVGIPAPVSFAYPGGPFAENAVPVLQSHGLTLARTTEQRAWNPRQDSPFRIPSFPLQKDSELAFYQALAQCREDNAVVLVFHGVPDLVHDFVSTSPSFFAKCMKYLRDNDYRVVGLSEYYREL